MLVELDDVESLVEDELLALEVPGGGPGGGPDGGPLAPPCPFVP
jgi:hypothetical protein